MEILKIICYLASISSLIGLIIFNCYFLQERKNNDIKLKDLSEKIKNLTVDFKSYQLHNSKDIKVWTEQAKYSREKFNTFEQQYIHHQSQIIEKIKKLEKND